jgi:hypothetical protein
MSRSSLSQFPGAIPRAVAEHFPHANRPSFRVEKITLILISKANSGADLNSLFGSRFRRLFAVAQSTAA